MVAELEHSVAHVVAYVVNRGWVVMMLYSAADRWEVSKSTTRPGWGWSWSIGKALSVTRYLHVSRSTGGGL